MASVRKRTWTAGGKIKTAWLVAYRDQQKERRFETFATKKDAEDRLVEIQGEIRQGIHAPRSKSITVNEAAKLWIEHGETEDLERSTLAAYKNHIEHLRPLVGETRLADLTKPGIETIRDKLLKQHSRAMAQKVLTSLKAIIGEAQRRGLVSQNVASGVVIELRKRRKLQVGVDIPSKSDIRAIIATAKGRWRPLLITAVFTGMRSSEIRGLRWSDVDLDKKIIHVRQRADQYNVIGATKSTAGERSIPIDDFVVNTLREWKLACAKGPLNLVFPNGKGRVENHGNIVNRGYDAIQRKAGIVDEHGKARYGMHALRHFYASSVIEQGFSMKKVQELLGHSSIQMSYDVYGHLFPSLEDDHAKLAAFRLSVVG